ncbi:ComEC/Rec2 family competence protein [Waddlia chondrophila]|uniref:Putative competence protein n=1 Tax=Waddlia chondrophila (strain ATCC VR-1470 / WSU 86-1044) TaxID=716544 RepID=D6YRT5_WADCW|nr:ComEC/Rec2 family competence protein [Waddlia chondrophila]ADI38780.1 putative competence protein [Waddlia chondrophila WSU 86-1044]
MKFSSKHPILIYASASLFGFYSATDLSPWLSIPLTAFFFLDRNRLLLCAILFCTFFAYSKINYPTLSIPPEGIHCQVLFTPSSVAASRSAFGTQWIYQGTATTLLQKNTVPCQIRLPKRASALRPPADRSYMIKGILKPGYGYQTSLYPDKEEPWLPIKGTWTPTEWRYASKQWVKGYVSRHYSPFQSAEFLGGILTGDFEDQAIKRSFGRAGLQHILAISGFHFTILTAVFLFFLRLLLPPKWALNTLLILLCSYFVFLGCGASILRAFLMSLCAIIGLLCRLSPVALNSLGFAVFAILAIDPLLVFSIGFVFSFSVTASILLFFPSTLKLLNAIFPSREAHVLKQMGIADQHCYLIVTAAKNTLALALAVNLTAIPLTLFFFGKFPLISLLCNLVVPLMVSISMFLFILGIFIPWLHGLNQFLVRILLDFVDQLPAPLHVHWRLPLNKPALLGWLTAAALLGIWGWRKAERRLEIIY